MLWIIIAEVGDLISVALTVGTEIGGRSHSFDTWHWSIVLLCLAVFIIPAWRIAAKAGFPEATSLLLLIPVVNIVCIWVFAFIEWPVQKPNA